MNMGWALEAKCSNLGQIKLVGMTSDQLQKQCRLYTERILTIKIEGVWQNNAEHHASGCAKKISHSQK